MELDLGLRLVRNMGNLSFITTETDEAFLVAAHLPGFKNHEIEVLVNDAGTEMSISGRAGERSSQEVAISRRLAINREVTMEPFKKVCSLPGRMIVDQICAVFDEREAILIILIPKLPREPHVVQIEEIKGENRDEEEDIASNNGETITEPEGDHELEQQNPENEPETPPENLEEEIEETKLPDRFAMPPASDSSKESESEEEEESRDENQPRPPDRPPGSPELLQKPKTESNQLEERNHKQEEDEEEEKEPEMEEDLPPEQPEPIELPEPSQILQPEPDAVKLEEPQHETEEERDQNPEEIEGDQAESIPDRQPESPESTETLKSEGEQPHHELDTIEQPSNENPDQPPETPDAPPECREIEAAPQEEGEDEGELGESWEETDMEPGLGLGLDGGGEEGGEEGGGSSKRRRRGRGFSLPTRAGNLVAGSVFILSLMLLVLHMLGRRRRRR